MTVFTFTLMTNYVFLWEIQSWAKWQRQAWEALIDHLTKNEKSVGGNQLKYLLESKWPFMHKIQ